MNPSNNQSAGILSPAPVEGQASVLPLPGPNMIPITSTSNGVAPSIQSSQAMAMTTIPLPVPAASVPNNTQYATPVMDTSIGFQVADDKDIIEPEWVNKAKSIVAHSRDDPYKQSEDLTVFKADYMQKRYNKTIKLK